MADLNKKDVEKIVKDEMDKFINRQFKTEMEKYMKDSSKGKRLMVDIVRKALEDLYKTLWIRRSIWTSEIGR